MLGYIVSVYHRPQAVLDLIEAIYSDDDAYVVSVDGQRDPALVVTLLPLLQLKNVRLIINRGVNWSGIAFLETMLEGMRLLLDDFPDIHYILTLSGECFPVRPRSELVAFLTAQGAGNFIFGHKLDTDALGQENDVAAAATFAPGALPRDSKMFNVEHLTTEVSVRGKTHFVFDPGLHFTVNSAARIVSMTYDRVAVDQICVAHPAEFFVSARKFFAKKYGYYWHKSWVALSRDFCEFVLNDELSFSIYDHVRNTWFPEETFFATLIHNSRFRDSYINHALTYDEPAKGRVIDESDITAIDSGQYFFARKFTEVSENVKQHYRRLVGPSVLPRLDGLNLCSTAPLADLFTHLVANPDVRWRFGRAFRDQPAFGALWLGRTGTILGYMHPHETSWRFNEAAQRLEFRSDTDEITTSFSSFVFSRNGNVYLFGQFRNDPEHVHYLESAIGAHMTEATAVPELLGWLHRRGLFPGETLGAGLLEDAASGAAPPSGARTDARMRCRIDGRCIGTIHAAAAPISGDSTTTDEPVARYWLASAGILVTGLPDVEFALILRGLWAACDEPVQLFGIARDFSGKLCSAYFEIIDAAALRGAGTAPVVG